MKNTIMFLIKTCFKNISRYLSSLALFVFLTTATGCVGQESSNAGNGDKVNAIIKSERDIVMTKKVGSLKAGYIYLPETFMKFHDAVSEGIAQDLQYSDGASIFTINIFQDENHILESAANSIASNWEAQGVQNIAGASIDINGYHCLQIYGDYNNGTHKSVAYVIQGKKQGGNIHLVTFEGPVDFLKVNLGYAETFIVE